jgi:hypothetical protein
MNLIILILGLACMAHLLVDFLQEIDYPIIHRKPFSCDLCMGFWVSIPFLCALEGWYGIPLSAITGVLADVIFRWKNNL